MINRKKLFLGVKSVRNLESAFFSLQFYQNSGSISQKNACLFLYMKCCFNIGEENLFNIKLLAFYISLPLSVLWTINLFAITNFIRICSMYSKLHHSWVTVKVYFSLNEPMKGNVSIKENRQARITGNEI